jgi:hypothetical protein
MRHSNYSSLSLYTEPTPKTSLHNIIDRFFNKTVLEKKGHVEPFLEAMSDLIFSNLSNQEASLPQPESNPLFIILTNV